MGMEEMTVKEVRLLPFLLLLPHQPLAHSRVFSVTLAALELDP